MDCLRLRPLAGLPPTEAQMAKRAKYEKRRAHNTALNATEAAKKRNRKAASLAKPIDPRGPVKWTVDEAAQKRKAKVAAHELARQKFLDGLKKQSEEMRAERKKHKLRL